LTGVGDKFVAKVLEEMINDSGILDPHDFRPYRALGPGTKSFDDVDEATLIALLREQPSRTLPSYQFRLLHETGADVSQSFISRFFNHALLFKASMQNPDLVLFDKYKEENLQRAFEYMDIISHIHPLRLKFGDEKLCKGK
jgi:hypothetical protein